MFFLDTENVLIKFCLMFFFVCRNARNSTMRLFFGTFSSLFLWNARIGCVCWVFFLKTEKIFIEIF